MSSKIDFLHNTIAYEVTDAPPHMAVVGNQQSPYQFTTFKDRVKVFSCPKKERQLLNLAAWNVRTTNNSENYVRPKRATAIICRELEKAGIDIYALSEACRPGSGNVKEKSHIIFSSGGEDSFAISNKLYQINPAPFSDRIMKARIQLHNGTYLTLISVYGPTMQRTPAERKFSMRN